MIDIDQDQGQHQEEQAAMSQQQDIFILLRLYQALNEGDKPVLNIQKALTTFRLVGILAAQHPILKVLVVKSPVGLQQAAEAIGVAIGSLIMARLADRIREGQWLAISYLSMAVATLVYSLSHLVSIAIFLMGVSGLLNAPSFIGRQQVIQRSTPREMRGRVNSAFFVVRDVMFVAGMALAGLADVFNVRTLFIISSFALMLAGAVVLILPGLGQPAAEWKRTISLLRGAEAAPRLGAGRTATRSEIDRFIAHMPEMMGMTPKERLALASQTLVAQAPGGKIVVYRGETSDMAYFILRGSAAAGYIKDEDYVILSYMREGDFFGQVAADPRATGCHAPAALTRRRASAGRSVWLHGGGSYAAAVRASVLA